MTEVESIQKLLENITISPKEYTPEEEYELELKASTEPPSTIDTKTLELLELLDKYETTVMRQMDINFKNGYLNLSRANYNSGSLSKTFGSSSIDMREGLASKIVNIDGSSLELVDLLQKQKVGISEKESIETANETENKEKDTVVLSEKLDVDSGLRNRKSKQSDKLSQVGNIKQQDEGPQLRDPILQFGALVPYQLRQSQSFFNKGLEDAITLIQLRNQVMSLIEEVQSLRAEEENSTQ